MADLEMYNKEVFYFYENTNFAVNSIKILIIKSYKVFKNYFKKKLKIIPTWRPSNG